MLAGGFCSLPLGTADEVRARISHAFPAADWTNPTWGELDENGYSIEFPVSGDTMDGLTLIVRGKGIPVPAISRFCQTNGWSGYDIGAERFPVWSSFGGGQLCVAQAACPFRAKEKSMLSVKGHYKA